MGGSWQQQCDGAVGVGVGQVALDRGEDESVEAGLLVGPVVEDGEGLRRHAGVHRTALCKPGVDLLTAGHEAGGLVAAPGDEIRRDVHDLAEDTGFGEVAAQVVEGGEIPPGDEVTTISAPVAAMMRLKQAMFSGSSGVSPCAKSDW